MKMKINGVDLNVDNVVIGTNSRLFAKQGDDLIPLAECKGSDQAVNILAALRALRLDAMFEMATTVHTLLECSEYAEQTDEMLQTAINTMAENGGDISEWSEMQAILDARKVMNDVTYEWEHQ